MVVTQRRWERDRTRTLRRREVRKLARMRGQVRGEATEGDG